MTSRTIRAMMETGLVLMMMIMLVRASIGTATVLLIVTAIVPMGNDAAGDQSDGRSNYDHYDSSDGVGGDICGDDGHDNVGSVGQQKK